MPFPVIKKVVVTSTKIFRENSKVDGMIFINVKFRPIEEITTVNRLEEGCLRKYNVQHHTLIWYIKGRSNRLQK